MAAAAAPPPDLVPAVIVVATVPDAPPHRPVLVERVAQLLASAPRGWIVDATVGAGGHSAAIQRARRTVDPDGPSLLGIDRDPAALELARETLRDAPGETVLVHARFDQLHDVLRERGIASVAGVLLDLGVSSMQLDRPDRGFSYRHDAPLDMRMDPTSGRDAGDLVNHATREELVRILHRYGEERFAARIADGIIRARPVTGTTELAEVVRAAIPAATRRTGGHPATRTFQALRIAVNDELGALERVLPVALDALAPGGVLVVIAYHSLEDRLVKRALAEAATGCVCPPGLPACVCGRQPHVELLTRRPERPTDAEVAGNPRARSARLRAARALSHPPEERRP